MKRVLMCLAVMTLLPTGAFAAEKKAQAAQEISFEEDTITGDLTKPDGEYVEARRKIEHTSLIRVREEFKDNVLQSASEL
ncbi:MAG: adventurous gliding motility protein CglF [Myxococcaceae bacterium]|nr:adventurous gliding motility protein CglF [Myxococcaceae bacterium]